MPNLDKLRIDSKNALERARASEESSVHSQAAMSAVIQNEASTRTIESRSASLQEKGNVLHKEQKVLNQSIEEEQIEATLHPQRLQEVKESAELDQMLFKQVQSILGSFSEIENKRLNQSSLIIETISSEAIKYTEEAKNAIKQFSIESFVKILDKIFDINYQDSDGRTLLMHVLSNGFFPAVDILLSNPDIDLDILDDKGQNALIYACSMPHIEYVEKILNRTKDISIIVPDTGNTPLHQVVATTSHRLFGDEYTKYYDLLSDGSDTDYINGCIGSLTLSKGNVSLGGGNPSTYHCINQAKTLLIVDQFQEKGVDLNTQNNNGHTPFTIACGYNLKYITNQWLDNGVVDINFQDNFGKTVLYWMCLSNNSDMVAYLLNKGADHNITEKQGFYPIHGATHNSFVEVINVLLKNGVDINIQSKNGVTPLYYSLGYGRQKINIDLVKFLLNNGADASIAMNDGDAPIHMAHYAASKEVIKVLLDQGVNLNVQNQELKTPLHCLIASDTLSIESKKEIIKLFRDKYDLSLQDKDGKTPIDYAEEQCPEAIEYLISDSFTKDSTSTNTSVHSSIFDDSQSLIASHATSETEVIGDQDSNSYSGM